MQSFFGIIMKHDIPAGTELLDAMAAAFDHGATARRIAYGRFGARVMMDPKLDQQPGKSHYYEDDQAIILCNGRIDPDTSEADTNKKYLFKSVYKYPFKSLYKYLLKYIYSAPGKIRGDYVIALFDKRNGKLTLLRDQLGTRPLYYFEGPAFFAFATEMKALRALPGTTFQMDETWIADFLSTVQSEKWRTPYAEIRRMLPGHMLEYDQAVHLKQVWTLEVQEEFIGIDYEQAVSLFRDKLSDAIEKRIRGASTIACELSGGLDSSGVTAFAKQLADNAGQSIHALTHAFSDASLGKFFPYNDEREFSLEVCNHTGINQVFCHADGYGLLEMLRKNIFIQSGPTQQGYSMFSDTLYDRGRELGVTRLLSGFGGDEGVTSKAGGFFEEMAAMGRWDLYKREYLTHAGGSGYTTMKRATRYYLKRYLPFAESFIMGFRNKPDWRAEKYPGLGFTREFEERMGIEQRFYERLGFPDDPEVRARQYKRIMHDHVSQRLEYSYLDAKAWGIEYAYPLWDIDLVEFYYSLPPEYKYRNGMGRAIYRDAMQGILPEKIRLRNDKTGATVPTVQQRFLADYDAITALIRRSREHNRYHYLDYDKMLAWQERIKNRGFNDKQPANPAAFFNSLQLLLLQEMEREGVFNV